jgi:hypothetical protein
MSTPGQRRSDPTSSEMGRVHGRHQRNIVSVRLLRAQRLQHVDA